MNFLKNIIVFMISNLVFVVNILQFMHLLALQRVLDQHWMKVNMFVAFLLTFNKPLTLLITLWYTWHYE